MNKTPPSNNVSDYVNIDRLLLQTTEMKWVWCKRDKLLSRLSPDFDTEEQAVDWIKLPEVLRDKKIEELNPLVKKMKELYDGDTS